MIENTPTYSLIYHSRDKVTIPTYFFPTSCGNRWDPYNFGLCDTVKDLNNVLIVLVDTPDMKSFYASVDQSTKISHVDKFVKDFDVLRKTLRGQFPNLQGPAILVGTSMGGYYASLLQMVYKGKDYVIGYSPLVDIRLMDNVSGEEWNRLNPIFSIDKNCEKIFYFYTLDGCYTYLSDPVKKYLQPYIHPGTHDWPTWRQMSWRFFKGSDVGPHSFRLWFYESS